MAGCAGTVRSVAQEILAAIGVQKELSTTCIWTLPRPSQSDSVECGFAGVLVGGGGLLAAGMIESGVL